MVHVNDEITGLQGQQLLEGQGLFVFPVGFLQPKTVVSLEQLVVRVDQDFEPLVDKAFAELNGNRFVWHIDFLVRENVMQALDLGGLPRHHHIDVSVAVIGL